MFSIQYSIMFVLVLGLYEVECFRFSIPSSLYWYWVYICLHLMLARRGGRLGWHRGKRDFTVPYKLFNKARNISRTVAYIKTLPARPNSHVALMYMHLTSFFWYVQNIHSTCTVYGGTMLCPFTGLVAALRYFFEDRNRLWQLLQLSLSRLAALLSCVRRTRRQAMTRSPNSRMT